MKDPKKIVKTVATDHDVQIHLADGTVLHVSSNKDSFHFSLSGVKTPTLWGFAPEHSIVSNNTQNCYYKRYGDGFDD